MNFISELSRFKYALYAYTGDENGVTKIGVTRELFYKILQELNSASVYTGRDFVKTSINAETINELKVEGVLIVIREKETF